MPNRATILVVANDEATRTLLNGILTEVGYFVQVVPSTAASFRVILAQRLPHLILCDCLISDGLIFARGVRSVGVDVPIVLITADRHPPSDLPNVAFCVLKPFDSDDLLDCVRTHVRHR
jgi:CheY-like chemotaxis protein